MQPAALQEAQIGKICALFAEYYPTSSKNTSGSSRNIAFHKLDIYLNSTEGFS
jgi:hypothetical protein